VGGVIEERGKKVREKVGGGQTRCVKFYFVPQRPFGVEWVKN